MKILHITEALGAGVAHYLELITKGQVKDGHEVVLAHSIRAETTEANIAAEFSFITKRIVVPMVTKVSLRDDLLSLWQLIRLIRAEKPDVIHLHSSKAGVLGRAAAFLSATGTRVFYSPHGFAFLREDVSGKRQKMFLWFERIAALLPGTLLACSATEADLAQSQVMHRQVSLVENAIDLNNVKHSMGGSGGVVNVLNASRVCYQKAPWRFQAVAKYCQHLDARFTWLGDGEWQPKTPINFEITGWLDRAEVVEHLSHADIFLMPSLWEGMPLALIEAQAAGIPAVVSNVVGCRDVVQHGVTGFVCNTDEELCTRTEQLINDAALRKTLGDNAAQMSRTRFSAERLNAELLRLYGQH